jgi:hypothetical protein
VHRNIRHLEIKLKVQAKQKCIDSSESRKKSTKLSKLYAKQEHLKTRILIKYPKNTNIEKLDILWAYAVFERPRGMPSHYYKNTQFPPTQSFTPTLTLPNFLL